MLFILLLCVCQLGANGKITTFAITTEAATTDATFQTDTMVTTTASSQTAAPTDAISATTSASHQDTTVVSSGDTQVTTTVSPQGTTVVSQGDTSSTTQSPSQYTTVVSSGDTQVTITVSPQDTTVISQGDTSSTTQSPSQDTTVVSPGDTSTTQSPSQDTTVQQRTTTTTIGLTTQPLVKMCHDYTCYTQGCLNAAIRNTSIETGNCSTTAQESCVIILTVNETYYKVVATCEESCASTGNRNTGRATWCCDDAFCNDNENNIPLPEPLRSGAVSVVIINSYMLTLYFVFQTVFVL